MNKKNKKKTILFGFSTILLITFVFCFQYIGMLPWLLIPVFQKFEGPFRVKELLIIDQCGTIKEETFGQGIMISTGGDFGHPATMDALLRASALMAMSISVATVFTADPEMEAVLDQLCG